MLFGTALLFQCILTLVWNSRNKSWVFFSSANFTSIILDTHSFTALFYPLLNSMSSCISALRKTSILTLLWLSVLSRTSRHRKLKLSMCNLIGVNYVLMLSCHQLFEMSPIAIKCFMSFLFFLKNHLYFLLSILGFEPARLSFVEMKNFPCLFAGWGYQSCEIYIPQLI